MPAGRRSARRQAVFALYQQDLLELTPEVALSRCDEAGSDPFSRSLVLGVAENRAVVDGLVARHLAGWSLERLGILERAILRVATYELLMATDVPAAVVIDEAVGLAKRFCSVEAGSLVNGVLGSLVDSGELDGGRCPAEHKGES